MYRLKILVFILLTSGCAAAPKLKNILGAKYTPSVLVNCNIYDHEFNLIKQLPGGRFCALNDDGSWVASDVDGIRKFSATGEKLWEHLGHFHHQVILDSANHVVALTSEFRLVYGVPTRFDAVVKYDQNGKELKRFSFFENFSRLLNIKLPSTYEAAVFSPVYKKRVPADAELSHANSIALHAGGYVVNDYMLKACILLNRDLRWEEKAFSLSVPEVQGLKVGDKSHDCHVLNDNSLLYYSNENEMAGKKTFQVFHFTGKEMLFRYPVKEENFVMSKWAGGVQKIDSFYFITTTDRENKTHFNLIDQHGQQRLEKTIDKELQAGRILNLTEFLKNNTI